MVRSNASIVALLLTFIVAACSPDGIQNRPTATPTQDLVPAGDYVPGLSEVPMGKVLFVLARSDTSGTGSCDFPVVEQVPLAFWYSSGVLEISSQGSWGWLSDGNLLDVSGQEIKGLGFFGYIQSNDYTAGGGIHDEIYYLNQLPFIVSGMSFVIHSILKDGAIIAGVGAEVYRFEPGRSWSRTFTSKDVSNPNCILTSKLSFINHGLLDIENVKFTDAPILP